jgi:ATP/maltotriose-dependent transcriptional regulator MalT
MAVNQSQSLRETRVLRSKLIKPQVSGKLVARELFSTFADEFVNGKKVGLVVAPAGYGKSTLLAESFDVLTDREVCCAWMSLDSEDNNPRRFTSHLLAALDGLSVEDFLVDAEVDDQSLGVDSKGLIEHFVSDTATKLDALAFQHALFIDDYHVISNPDIHILLERLVLYSSDKTMFIIASRVQPDLAFKTLRVREKVCELTTRELAFGIAESEQFLNEAKQLGLDSKLVQALDRRTEGWVAGLQLASLALVGQSDSENFIREFSGTDRDVTDYLGEVVLQQQSEHIRRFLLSTSLLERMNADLANAVLGIGSAQAILEQIDAQNLFVIPLDRNREWYRYHHLFKEFLTVQMTRNNPNDVEEVYQRAVTWCMEQHHQREAISYALRGGLFDRAAQLIADIAKSLLQVSGEHWTMLQWVRQLPQDYPSIQPDIAVAYSWSLIFTRQYSEARDLLEMLADFSVQQDPETGAQLRYGIKLNECVLEGACDNSERGSELVKEWLQENPDAEAGDLMTAYVMQSYSSLATFELDTGIAAAENAIKIGQENSLDYFHAWGRACAGMLNMQRADLRRAVEHYKKGLERNNRNTSAYSYMGSLNTVLLAEACYEQNDLTQAETLLQDRFEYIDNESVVEVAYASYRVLARLQILQADLDAGLNVIRLGKESASETGLPRLVALLCALEVHSLIQAGKSEEAQAVAHDSGFDESSLKPDIGPAFHEIHELVIAELLLDQGQPERALQVLDPNVARLEGEGRLRRLMEVMLLRCCAQQRLQQRDEALASLGRAVEIGAQGGFYRVFLDANSDIHQLLKTLVKMGAGELTANVLEFLEKLDASLQYSEASQRRVVVPGEAAGVVFETLTKRERQMLDTISGGETNKEIADALFISEQTVKWHLHQLYQKLGVKNRTSAIARARHLKLI